MKYLSHVILRRGLFINNKRAKDSIYESGLMVFKCLSVSEEFSIDYCEVDQEERSINTGYDFYLFNYHVITMNWLDTAKLKKLLGCVGTIILEVAPGDPFIMCPAKDFSFYCILDPTIKPRKNLFVFPRPLDIFPGVVSHAENDIPVIGSFGFATKGKGFHHVVDAVNKEFDKAIIRLNIPYGDFVPESETYAKFLAELCIKKAKPGIEVRVTHDFMQKDDLIKWCANNTLNCFLYDRDMPGLSATTDQAIISERPLAISQNDTFRHIEKYIRPYPAISLKDSILNSSTAVLRMKEDWKPANFAKIFERMLVSQNTSAQKNVVGKVTLPVLKSQSVHNLKLKFKRYVRKIKKLNINSLLRNNDNKHSKKVL